HLQGLAPGEMEQDWMPQGPAAVNHLSSIALPITKSLSRSIFVPEREFSLKLDATLDDSKTRSIRSLVNWAKTAQYIEPGTIEPRLSCNRGTHELSPKKGPRTSKIQPSFAAETPLQHGDVLPCITPRQNASTYYCMLIFDIISAAIACCPTHMNPDRRCDVEQRANQGYREPMHFSGRCGVVRCISAGTLRGLTGRRCVSLKASHDSKMGIVYLAMAGLECTLVAKGKPAAVRSFNGHVVDMRESKGALNAKKWRMGRDRDPARQGCRNCGGDGSAS
ncbi:hypothetical protein FOC1_g10013890, partial [Fusarium oxysporum f. sp. cubense race 1]